MYFHFTMSIKFLVINIVKDVVNISFIEPNVFLFRDQIIFYIQIYEKLINCYKLLRYDFNLCHDSANFFFF